MQFASSQNIDGRWIAQLYEGDPGNTMFEFVDGLRYTYYCADDNGCDSTYWNSLDTSDAIPNPNPYTFINDTLTIDIFFGNIWQRSVTFECDGDIVSFSDTTFDEWWRIGLDTNECENQQLRFSNITNTPEKFKLNQNYPNPFNPVTTIGFSLEVAGNVSLKVYDLNGREVTTLVDGHMDQGSHNVGWNGRDAMNKPVSAGLYIYAMTSGGSTITKKMVLMK